METVSGCSQDAEGASIKTLDIDLSELEDIRIDQNSPGYSMKELCRMTGHDRRWMAGKLQVLQASGKLQVGKRTELRIDGRRQQIPVYRW